MWCTVWHVEGNSFVKTETFHEDCRYALLSVGLQRLMYLRSQPWTLPEQQTAREAHKMFGSACRSIDYLVLMRTVAVSYLRGELARYMGIWYGETRGFTRTRCILVWQSACCYTAVECTSWTLRNDGETFQLPMSRHLSDNLPKPWRNCDNKYVAQTLFWQKKITTAMYRTKGWYSW